MRFNVGDKVRIIDEVDGQTLYGLLLQKQDGWPVTAIDHSCRIVEVIGHWWPDFFWEPYLSKSARFSLDEVE